MNKILPLLLVGVVSLGAVSCKKTENQPEKKDTTKTAMRVIASEQSSLRAATQNDANGQGGESEVAKAAFITFGKTDEFNYTGITGTAGTAPSEKVFTSNPFEYTGVTGTQNAALILNPVEGFDAGLYPDKTIEISKLSMLADKNGFTMSSVTTNEVNIQKGVEAGQIAEGKNLFKFQVERVVAKVQVVNSQDIVYAMTLSDNGTMKDLKYSLAGSAKKAYIFGNNAGKRVLSDQGVYDNFKSAIHTVQLSDHSRDLTKVSDKKENNVVAPFSTSFENRSLAISKVEAQDVKTSQNGGIFFLENSLDKQITKTGDLKYNEIAYVKVYGAYTFNANKLIKKVKTAGSEYEYASADDINTEHTYKVEVTAAVKAKLIEKGIEEGKFEAAGSDKFNYSITDKPGTFYRGQNGKYYLTLEASRADGNNSSEKYSEGKMVWMTPANNQMDATGKFTKYADTRRNNIYSLDLKKIDAIGGNYDPVDPEDPNVPKPNDNPDEPEKDPEVPVDPVKTNIKVEATILQWNIVSRDLTLK